MFCPSCGASVSATKFCENCGRPLPDAQGTSPIEQPTEPVSDYAQPGVQPTAQMPQQAESASSYVAEVPGDSAWQAQPQQAYQANQTGEIPYQPPASDYVPYADGPQPPYRQPTSSYQAPIGPKAPNAAFVLVIVGLVLSLLFVTFIPGLICSIIGLVLNASYNRRGLSNPRKTPTLVIGIIGVVMAILCLVFTVAVGVLTVQVMDEADRQGVDLMSDDVKVTTDSNGSITVKVGESSGSASTSNGTKEKSSAASSASAAASSASAAASASSAAASASSAAASSIIPTGIDYSDARYHDTQLNPTLYSAIELTGAEMSGLLDYCDFDWDDDLDAWYASSGAMYAVLNTSGELSKSKVEALPKGAAGEDAILALAVSGYKTPTDAFNALSKGVTVDDSIDIGDALMAIVHNSSGVEYLILAADSGDGTQVIMVFTEESVSGGYFAEILGFDAGSSIDEVWKFVKSGLSFLGSLA